MRLQREERLSVERIGEVLRGREEPVGDQRDIRFLLSRGRRLVNIEVKPVATAPGLDDGLARDLRQVTGMRVLVVKCDPAGEDHLSQDAVARAQARRDSVALHASLGAVAAIRLAGVLRDNDKIAVGPGRAVSSTIKALGAHQGDDLTARGLSVTSLGGGMIRAPFLPPDAIVLVDADYNAAQLALGLAIPVARVKLCYLPAFAPADRCDELIDLLAPHLSDLDANVLLYGCGVIDDSHYLLRMEDPQTEVIRQEADRLRELVKRHPGAVIDFCDEFFAAPGVPEDLTDDVRDIVARLRKAAVRIAPAQLARPPERILVAGGRRKIEALALLTDESWDGPRPTTLVTDSSTARTLLARSRGGGGERSARHAGDGGRGP